MKSNKTKWRWLCCVAAILSMVVTTNAQAALFEDDFDGSSSIDTNKWTQTGGTTAPGDVIEVVTEGSNNVAHFHSVGGAGMTSNSLTTKTSFGDDHTLTVDVKRPTGAVGQPAFNFFYGSGAASTRSYHVDWGQNHNVSIFTYHNSTWAHRGTLGGTSLNWDTWYHFEIINSDTSVGINIYESDGITLVDSGTYSHDSGMGSDRTLIFKCTANAGNTVGGYIDNVVVTPEPATMVLLGLGGVGLLIRRRRRAA